MIKKAPSPQAGCVRVTLPNAGPATALNVVLTDTTPALLADPAVVYAGPEVIAPLPGSTFAWTVADLLPGQGGTVQVRATVDPAAPPGSVIVNEARLTSTNPE